jgi:predicted GIY-YIG superfamily endonuclease
MSQMESPDYVRLAAEVLKIHNAPPALARRLVQQALVIEDRRETWLETGERICAAAPALPGVYVLRASDRRALYVGKANNIRRRLRTHFAARRWRTLKPEFARATDVEWRLVGSEIEALIREAEWIRDLQPVVNVQVAPPALDTRAIPRAVLRDTIIVLPSAEPDAVELLAARLDGRVRFEHARRDGARLATAAREVWSLMRSNDASAFSGDMLAPLVFSWLAGRGARATRIDPADISSARELQRRIEVLLRDDQLFSERIVVIRSGFRSTSTRP